MSIYNVNSEISAFNRLRDTGWFKLSDEQKDALMSVSEYKEGRFIADNQPLTVKELLKIEAS